MKVLRLILSGLAAIIVLAAVLVGLAFVPAVQTWYAQQTLDAHPRLQGTIGGLSATFGNVELTDLHLKTDRGELTLPSVTAELPLLNDVRGRILRVRRLEAKGWTLDLTGRPASLAEAEAAAASGAPPPVVTAAFREILSQWILPCAVALDGVDLEGDVLVGTPGGKGHTRLHVTLRGGGLTADHPGTFALTAATTVVDSQLRVTELGATGRLAVTLATPRTFRRLDLTAAVSAKGGPFPTDLVLDTHASVEAGPSGEVYGLDLNHGTRRLVHVATRLTAQASELAGSWALDLQDADFAPFVPDRPLPGFQAAGSGQFDCDATFSRVHARGDLTADLSRLEAVASAWGNLGTVHVVAGFDATRGGGRVRVERLSAKLTGTGPAATVHLLGACEWDERRGHLQAVGTGENGMEVSLERFPLGWIAGLPGGLTFSSGTAAGEFVIAATANGFVLHPAGPLRATGVSLQRGGVTVAENLDLTADLVAAESSDGWQIQAAPLRVARGGRPLAELALTLNHPANQDLAIRGQGHADLQAIAAAGALPGLSWLSGRSLAGDFSATTGAAPAWDAKVSLVGDDPRDVIAGSIHADIGSEGGVSFLAPVKLSIGPASTEISAEGKWSQEDTGPRLYLKLSGEKVVLEHLRLLAEPFARAGQTPGSGAEHDRVPFWGNWLGTLQIAFDHLQSGAQNYADVSGTFEVDHTSIQLEAGHLGLEARRFANFTGVLTFSGTASLPYQLKGSAAIDPFKAGPFFPAPVAGDYPIIEGRIGIAATAAGSGINFADLVRHAAVTFQLTSTDAIVRFLKTEVHDAIPQVDSSRTADGLSMVGSNLGSFFGLNRDGGRAPNSKLSPNTEAVLNFIAEAAELGFDQATVTVVRDSAGSFHLTKIDLTAERERLSGTGEITAVPGVALLDEPLSLELQLGAKGRIARLLGTAGLLSGEKDDQGYAQMKGPVHFGGSLRQIDPSAWHRLLVKAAVPLPPAPKKKSP